MKKYTKVQTIHTYSASEVLEALQLLEESRHSAQKAVDQSRACRHKPAKTVDERIPPGAEVALLGIYQGKYVHNCPNCGDSINNANFAVQVLFPPMEEYLNPVDREDCDN